MTLTRPQLESYEKRINEIIKYLNNDTLDDDIVDNLNNELEEIDTILTKYLKL